MKKIILNVLLAILLASAIAIICVAGIFLSEINSAPQLLVHIIPTNGTLPYYVIQHDLVNRWKTYCTAILVVSSISAIFPLFGLFYINISSLSDEERARRKEARKTKKIEALRAELEDLEKLKND